MQVFEEYVKKQEELKEPMEVEDDSESSEYEDEYLIEMAVYNDSEESSVEEEEDDIIDEEEEGTPKKKGKLMADQSGGSVA